MKYNFLGRTGLKVSAIGLGTNSFGFRADRKTSLAILDRALDAGVTLVDTANVYGNSASETILGEGLKGRRDEVILATKVGADKGTEGVFLTQEERRKLFEKYPKHLWIRTPAGWRIANDGSNNSGTSRLHMMRELEGSLRRLQTDYIDLYQVHEFDDHTRLDDTLRTLDDMVRSGKVRYIGVAQPAYMAWQLCKALWTSDLRGYVRLESVQLGYSLRNRAVERDIIPLCQDQGIGLIAFSPLSGGVLTGKYRPGEAPPKGSRAEIQPAFAAPEDDFGANHMDPQGLKLGQELVALATELRCAPSQLALAWLIGRPGLTSAIVGATSVSQEEENLACVEVDLPEAILGRLEEMSRPFV